jgi:hypothetical protein
MWVPLKWVIARDLRVGSEGILFSLSACCSDIGMGNRLARDTGRRQVCLQKDGTIVYFHSPYLLHWYKGAVITGPKALGNGILCYATWHEDVK